MFPYTITVDLILLIITHSTLIFIIFAGIQRIKSLDCKYAKRGVDLLAYKTQLEHTKEKTEAFYKEQFKSWCIVKKKGIRKDATTRSRKIMRGQATEHLAPLMMKDLNAKDFRFMGNPIDFVVFSGASDVTDGTANKIEKVLFVDIKTGKSKLSKVQRRIRDCIIEGRVEFLEYNPDKNEENNV